MSTHGRTTARDFFTHLLGIAMLYTAVVSFIALLWQYINVGFPDPLDFYYTGVLDIIRNSMATLIVVWPVYIIMSWLVRKDMKAFPEKADIWVRKWLMYLTLFVAAVTIVIDLVNLINSFLSGELTLRFALKVLAILVVAVVVFWYYLWDLKEEGALKSTLPKQMAIGVSFVLAVAIIGGFFLVGTPAQQRLVRFDEQRVNDLSLIQGEIVNQWTQKRVLPATLDALTNDISGFRAPVDPSTGASYEYSVKDELTFELCATFETDSESRDATLNSFSRPQPYMYEYGYPMGTWDHGAERTCFERTIDPELYPEPTK
jgi:hypothetical protein